MCPHHRLPLRNKESWVLEQVERGQSYLKNQDTVCPLRVARTSAAERKMGEGSDSNSQLP